MGFVGNAVKKVFKTVGLAPDSSGAVADSTSSGVGAASAPAEANTAEEGKSNDKIKKRKRGKASLLIKPDTDVTGGGTGINL